jgi:hypothetical protein
MTITGTGFNSPSRPAGAPAGVGDSTDFTGERGTTNNSSSKNYVSVSRPQGSIGDGSSSSAPTAFGKAKWTVTYAGQTLSGPVACWDGSYYTSGPNAYDHVPGNTSSCSGSTTTPIGTGGSSVKAHISVDVNCGANIPTCETSMEASATIVNPLPLCSGTCTGPSSENLWVASSANCPSGQYGTHTWEREQTHTRTCTAGTWSAWSGWTNTGATRSDVNTCKNCGTTSSSQVVWQARSQACPSGQTGSHTWEEQRNQSRTGTYSCPAGTTTLPAPTWGAWVNGSWTGTKRNEVNTCAIPTAACTPGQMKAIYMPDELSSSSGDLTFNGMACDAAHEGLIGMVGNGGPLESLEGFAYLCRSGSFTLLYRATYQSNPGFQKVSVSGAGSTIMGIPSGWQNYSLVPAKYKGLSPFSNMYGWIDWGDIPAWKGTENFWQATWVCPGP